MESEMKGDPRMKSIIALVAEFPTLVLERIEQGTHYKLFLDTPCGKKLLVVSRSASDFRAIRNNRSLLRQWASSQVETNHG
jgi:hypothetical protein